jgi:hypothetical protein
VLEQISWIATAISAIVTLIGVVVAILAVGAAHLQRRRQFETIYVQRYWVLMDQLSLDAIKGRERPQINPTDQHVIRSYLRLCEDELELRREGWISEETWAIWRTGILAQIQRWPFKAVWCEVDRQTGPGRPEGALEEFSLLRKFLPDGEGRGCRWLLVEALS